jgi:hypothetical protein
MDLNKSQAALDEQRDQHLLIIEECYSVIINMFLALHNCIQDSKDSSSLLSRVDVLIALK